MSSPQKPPRSIKERAETADPGQYWVAGKDGWMVNDKARANRAKKAAIAKMFPPKPKADPSADPSASESVYWKPKGSAPQQDARWIKDGGWSGK